MALAALVVGISELTLLARDGCFRLSCVPSVCPPRAFPTSSRRPVVCAVIPAVLAVLADGNARSRHSIFSPGTKRLASNSDRSDGRSSS
jgi:hypothetical protein